MMTLMRSVSYFISLFALLYCMFRDFKSSKSLNGIEWLIISCLIYEYGISFICGILTLIKVPVTLWTVVVINLAAVLLLVYKQRREKKIQCYYWKAYDFFVLGLLTLIVLLVSIQRFGAFSIVYATSDPSRHLQMAMDAVQAKSVMSSQNSMFIGQFTNALFIEMCAPIWSGVSVYIPFVIKDVLNLWIAGAVFFWILRRNLSTAFMKGVGAVSVLLYLLGYPLSNMLFGFVYLGISVTAILFTIWVSQRMTDGQLPVKLSLMLLSLGLFAVSLSYTLFAPPVYFAVFVFFILWMKQEGKLFSGKKRLSRRFFTLNLSVFLPPTLSTIVFVMLYPKLQGGLQLASISKMDAEGYIYRNLWLDFFVYLPFAIYAAWKHFKKREADLGTSLLGCFFIFKTGMFLAMWKGVISSYYFYKVNYVMWGVILFLAIEGIGILKQHRSFIVAAAACYMGACAFSLTGIDNAITQKNIAFNPYPESSAVAEIYLTNKTFYSIESHKINQGLIEICKEVDMNYLRSDGFVPYIGSWLENYWYEALTNQRQGLDYAYIKGATNMVQQFLNGDYGEYIVVQKDSEEYAQCISLLEQCPRVYENSYAFIAQRIAE